MEETPKVNTKALADYNPFDPETLSCPYDFNRQLREQAPVYQCPKTGVFFVSTFDLVTQVAKNEKVFSNKFARIRPNKDATGHFATNPSLSAVSKKYSPIFAISPMSLSMMSLKMVNVTGWRLSRCPCRSG